MRKIMKRALSWFSVSAMLVTMMAVGGFTLATTAADSTVLFSENFDSYANGVLPSNWTISSDSGYTDIKVQDGGLVINGRGSDSQTRVFYQGPELKDRGSYVFEADYSILESDYALSSSTRYSGMIFRADSSLQKYYYVTTRVRTGTSNNEFSIRNSSSSFKKIAEAAAPFDQALNTVYHLKVIANGANVKFYIDNYLVFNYTLDTSGADYSYMKVGDIGFTTSNLKIKIDNIKVSTIPVTQEGDTLFKEDFNSTANGKLPDGWSVSSDSGYTDVSVQNGRLVINGIGTDLQTRVAYLGSELVNKSDYIFEADYTILESATALTSSTRYSAMMFRANSSIYPYYYCTTRVKPGVNNELSIRNNSDSSSYKQLALVDAPAQQEIGKTYHLKVICCGANVKYYIDNTLVFNYTLDTSGSSYSYLSKGTIGFTTSNMKVAFDNVVVTETEAVVAAQPSLYDTYIPDTNIVNPPSVITNVTSADVYNTLTGSKLPATTIYYLNKDMNVTTPDGGTVIASLASALTKTNGKVIPALYVKDKATVDALTAFAVDAALQDAFVIADTPELLKYARDKNVNFYGVLYTKLNTAASKSDLAAMYANTNKGWGKTVMVDAKYVSKDDVAYLQKRLMNVWVIGDLTAEEKYENIYKGVNGIVDTDHAGTYWIYENTNGVFNSSSDSTPIVICEPFMYAHRGYSAYANQNTMEAFYGAIDYGTDLIEMDVRLTSDGVVVIYHDEYLYTLTDCTDTTKKVENCTYAELMKYNVDYLSGSGVANSKIATLREFLELIAQTDDVVGILEIKNYDVNLVDKTAATVKEMGLEDQVVSICFGKAYCDRMRQQLPGVSVGWLANGISDYTTGAQIVNYAKGYIMSGNLTYHPNYGQIQNNSTGAMRTNVIEFAAQRGISYNPWTLNDAKIFDYEYVSGIQGLTTD
ncbi:MAG: DUF1080 domain-containing protein, partial [Clostridia bacterium]|nr:DUF1080 domain-containing protein [Clostridia bacterium]